MFSVMVGHNLKFIVVELDFQCQWKQCNRIKKNSPPFPNLARLMKHVKELHLIKSNGRTITLVERTKLVISHFLFSFIRYLCIGLTVYFNPNFSW